MGLYVYNSNFTLHLFEIHETKIFYLLKKKRESLLSPNTEV